MEKRKRRNLIIASVILLAGGVSPLIFRYVDCALARSRLEAKKREIHGAGYATSLAEAWPPPVPDDENASTFYMKAFKAFKPADAAGRALIIGDFAFWGPEVAAERMRWLAENAHVVELVREGRSRPRCRYDRNLLEGPGRSYDEYRPILDLIEFLAYDADRWASQGDLKQAAELMRDALAIAASFRDEPLPQSQSLYFRGLLSAFDRIRHGGDYRWPVALLEMFRDLLPDPKEVRGCAARGLRGWLAHSADVASGPAEKFWALDPEVTDRYGRWEKLKMRAQIARDGAVHLDRLRRATEAYDKPWPEAEGILLAIPEEYVHDPFEQCPVSLMMDTNVYINLRNEIETIAWLVVLRTGLDLEIAHARDGRYPETATGIDPFTEKPLLREGRMISSIGPQEGTGVRRLFGSGVVMDHSGGICWRLFHEK